MLVAVTGASGFLGRATVESLLSHGFDVKALVRKTSNVDWLVARGVPCAIAPLVSSGVDAIRDAVEGCDAVVHLAGGGRVRRAADFLANNTATTEALVAGVNAAPHGPRSFVFVSSMAARGPSPSADRAASSVEDAPITAYGRAKLAAEEALGGLRDDVRVSILRPPGIYGPGDDRMLPLYQAAQRGLIPLPAAGRTASFIYVDDCARAIVSAVQDSEPRRPMYVEDGDARALADTADTIAAALGTNARIVRVPKLVLTVAATIAETSAKLRNRPLLLTRDKVRELTQPHWVCDSDPFRAATGWAHEIEFEDGVERTVHDYRRRGWIA